MVWQIFSCTHCQVRLLLGKGIGRVRLVKAILSIIQHNMISHECKQCGKRFTRKDSLKVHIGSVHNEISLTKLWNYSEFLSKSPLDFSFWFPNSFLLCWVNQLWSQLSYHPGHRMNTAVVTLQWLRTMASWDALVDVVSAFIWINDWFWISVYFLSYILYPISDITYYMLWRMANIRW